MKEVKAYIRKEKLDSVVNALAKVEGLSGVSLNSITGFGRSRGILKLVDFTTHIKVEAVCQDEIKDEVIQTILEAARSGQRGDGKVFVSSIEEAWRIENRSPLTESP